MLSFAELRMHRYLIVSTLFAACAGSDADERHEVTVTSDGHGIGDAELDGAGDVALDSDDSASADVAFEISDSARPDTAADTDARESGGDAEPDVVADAEQDVSACSNGLLGAVTAPGGAPIERARVTIVGPGESFVEARTDSQGKFRAEGLVPGTYTLGVSALGQAYDERVVTVTGPCTTADFVLGPETELGATELLGDPGERLGGTNSGVLLPDGRLMYCHDTRDPVIFDPVSREKVRPPESPRIQGCHAVTLLPDGRLLYVGGADVDGYGPGTRQVKTFDPIAMKWEIQPDLVAARWYPTMVPLPDGQLVAAGGGGVDNPLRVKTSETFDPATLTWTAAGDIAIGNEVSPVVLLYTGKVLMTHRPPQLYDPATRSWSLAADFVQGDRMPNGDHADHELVLLPDGRVLAIGHKSFVHGRVGELLEIYDPDRNEWALGASFAPARSRPSAVLLPDARVLVLSGEKEDDADPTPVNAWNYMALADLYDPARNSWRRVAPMALAREYHMMPILVPDGRVIIVGGEGAPGNEPALSTIEAMSPPYLFRGPRPEIHDLAQTSLARGASFVFRVTRTAAPTKVVLIGTSASTHFMDSGNGRYLELPFSLAGDQVTATIPAEPARSVLGWYTLFVLVDDIPSVGRVVRVVAP
ncbi:MAG: DUF1929 domain-containing protein [Deltaproteobacteria bacterium]|nr:DUF1929 domain-containing protein [Deltaproteobacteria bacterium]